MAYDYSFSVNPADWYNALSGFAPAAVPQLYSQEPVTPAATAPLAGALSSSTTPGLPSGTGSPTAITPINTGPMGANTYAGGDTWARGLAGTLLPQGQSYNISQFGGDNLDLGTFLIGENNPIRITDQNGNVLYSGTGYAGAQEAADLTKQLVGNKDVSKFSVEGYDPYTGSWQGLAGSARPTDGWGELADVVLPVVGGMIAGPLGAAAGAAASGTAQGKSIKEIGISSALAGAGSYLGGKIPGINLGSSVPASAASSAAGTTAGSALGTGGEILVSRFLPSAVGSAIGGGGSAALANALANSPNAQALNKIDPNQITVSGQIAPPVNLGTGAGAFVPGAADAFTNPVTGANEIPVTAQPQTPNVNAGSIGGALGPIVVNGALGNEMILTGQTQKPDLGPGSVVGALGGTALGSAISSGATGNATTGGTTLKDVSDWLRLAGLVSPLIGALGGGGGSSGSSGATISGNTGALNPTFSAKLPTATLPGLAAGQTRAQRDMSATDWNRYAFGPEKSFFTDVPEQKFAKGGALTQSDGRSDDIPALLSDGEYVIDAETMALLGNGDPKAGADRMDQWRVNVRKHKGRDLAKGKISRNAKMPNEYMGGGRI